MANKYAGTKTEKNLWEAFAGESQARNKYTYFASAAKKQGFEQIAALFLKTAENEKEHAKLWFKELGELGTTEENLLHAAEGENFEWTDMYERMAKEAEEARLEEERRLAELARQEEEERQRQEEENARLREAQELQAQKDYRAAALEANEIPEAELTPEEKQLIAQREAIEKLINDKPEEVALLVKTWLSEE